MSLAHTCPAPPPLPLYPFHSPTPHAISLLLLTLPFSPIIRPVLFFLFSLSPFHVLFLKSLLYFSVTVTLPSPQPCLYSSFSSPSPSLLSSSFPYPFPLSPFSFIFPSLYHLTLPLPLQLFPSPTTVLFPFLFPFDVPFLCPPTSTSLSISFAAL